MCCVLHLPQRPVVALPPTCLLLLLQEPLLDRCHLNCVARPPGMLLLVFPPPHHSPPTTPTGGDTPRSPVAGEDAAPQCAVVYVASRWSLSPLFFWLFPSSLHLSSFLSQQLLSRFLHSHDPFHSFSAPSSSLGHVLGSTRDARRTLSSDAFPSTLHLQCDPRGGR